MANSRQEYFILRSDVPIAKASNFLRKLLITLNGDYVLKGELLVKEPLPQESSHQSHAIYSLALDRNKKVSCSNTDVIPLSEDDYEWLAPIQNVYRWQFYVQGDKLESAKALKVGDNVWVTITAGDGMPYHLTGSSCCHATVQYIGPLQDTPGRWIGVELKEKQGSCDGSYRDARYFFCDDGYGEFLPASNILTILQSSSACPIPTSSTLTLQHPLMKLYTWIETDMPMPTQPIPPHPVSHNLEVASAVELVDPPGYGIIRWIGKFPGVNTDVAGVELDMKMEGCGDGSWDDKRYFTCKDGHAMFIVLSKLKPDQRHKKRHSSSGEPTVQTCCSCECKLVKDQVCEIKTHVLHNNESIAAVRGQVGSCEEAFQANDQQIEKLQDEVQSLQQTSIHFQEAGVTERRQLREELATVKGQVIHFQEELATVRGQLVSCEEAKEELQQTIADLREEQVQRENEFTSRLTAIEAQMRALLPPWAIPETELEATETVLGKGAYGEVRVGVYHGDRVAVKRLHNVIASDYYQKMIQREMGIAARLRHPKLVLFIGAVTRGNLTIVTELMETSLRSELEHGRLKEDHILSISRDVACALCYLHSLPEPIIHRDVSSANVLLNSTKGGWVAKLGDYGSANFQAKLQTVGPGCPVYAAPEASRPEEQGPKMDVYSYGVLVLEMCTGTLPDPRDLPVIQQAVHSWRQPKRQLGGLACQCTLQSSDRRPHMRNVVTQLNGM